MNDEKDRILKMLEEKKITADDAARLLDALNRGEGGRPNRFLKVRVYDDRADKAKVNITLPIGLVKWAMSMAPESAKAKFQEHEVDVRLISDALEKGIPGKIVDVQDEEKGEHVEVWLE